MRTTTLILSAAMLIAGCASEAEYSREELNPDLTTTMAPHLSGTDAGDCSVSSDCKKACNVGGADLYQGYFEGTTAPNVTKGMWPGGYFEQIDNACHEFTFNEVMGTEGHGNFLGDVDVIAVKSQPGVPLKISVEASNHSKIEPVVSIYNSTGQVLVVSEDLNHEGKTEVYMRSPIMLPTTDASGSPIPVEYYKDPSFFIAVEHLANYKRGWLDKCHKGDMDGGNRYGFIVKVEKDDSVDDTVNYDIALPYFDTEFKTYTGRINKRGEVQYISVIVPRKATSVKVELLPNSNHTMIMSLIDTSYNQMVWVQTASFAEAMSRTIDLTTSKYVYEDVIDADPQSGNVDGSVYRFTLAVADSIGYSGYGYTLKVTPVF